MHNIIAKYREWFLSLRLPTLLLSKLVENITKTCTMLTLQNITDRRRLILSTILYFKVYK